MAAHPPHRQHRWQLLGLVLVAAFLGHDLGMTAAQAASPDHSGTHHDAAVAADPHQDGSPEHPSDCGVTRSAAPRAIDQPDAASDPTLFSPLAAGVQVLSEPSSPAWDAPTSSPAVRRAVLQVFRL